MSYDEYYEKHEMEGNILDFVIQQAKFWIFGYKGDVVFQWKAELKKLLSELQFQGTLWGELERAFDEFECEVKEALETLSGSFTLGLSSEGSEGEEGDRLSYLLTMLDCAVFLAQYLRSGELPELNSFASRADEIDDLIVVEEGFVLYHRLIPFNQWRREQRADLPEELLPELPWYDFFVDVDPLSLVDVTENLERMKSGDFSSFGEQAGLFQVLFDSIKKDKAFLRELEGRAWAQKHLIWFLSQSKAYGLFFLIERSIDLADQLDPEVEAFGYFEAAILALELSSDEEWGKVERLFLQGFFLPLDDEDRLDLFREVEKNFSLLTSSPTGTLGRALYQWGRGVIDDDLLAKRVFGVWRERLLSVVEKK